MSVDTIDRRGPTYYLGSLTAILVILFFRYLVPAWGPVTEVGVGCLGVFLGMIIAIISTGEALWPAMFAMISLTLCGYYPSYEAAIRDIFGHPLVYNFFLITALITAMNEIGMGKAIALIILTRKGFQKKPLLLSFVFLMTFVIAVNFMNVLGSMLLAFPLLDALLRYIGIDKKDNYAKFMNLGLFLSISIGAALRGAIMPDYLVRVGFFNTALEGTGITVDLWLYTAFGAAAVTAFIASYVLAMRYVFRCDFGKLSHTDFREIEEFRKGARLNRYQVIFLCSFIVFTLFAMLSKSIPVLSQISPYGALGIVCALLSFLRYPNEQGNPVKLFDFSKYLQKVNWNLAISLGLFSVIGTAIGSEACGIKEWFTDAVSVLLNHNDSSMLVILCILGISVITHVFNNNATATIFASLIAPLSVPFVVSGRLNPALLLSCISLCSQSGFMTMAACGTAPLLYSREGISHHFIWTGGFFMELLLVAVVIIMYFLFSLL